MNVNSTLRFIMSDIILKIEVADVNAKVTIDLLCKG